MRIFWTGIDALSNPVPVIVRMHNGRYLLEGAVIVGPSFGWTRRAAGGAAREVLIGIPIKPPQPKHRKGKRSPVPTIKGPLFRHP
jgi:hypothetical protein